MQTRIACVLRSRDAAARALGKTAVNFPTLKGETRVKPPAGWMGAARSPLGGRAAAAKGQSGQLRKRSHDAAESGGGQGGGVDGEPYFRGVSKRSDGWHSQYSYSIRREGPSGWSTVKNIGLGVFSRREEAARAWCAAPLDCASHPGRCNASAASQKACVSILFWHDGVRYRCISACLTPCARRAIHADSLMFFLVVG